MAAERITPTDELTGLPLPVVPVQHPERPDWHHHFHPRRSPLLQDLGGQAVRSVRVQKVDYRRHHYDYHNEYLGPPLPKTEKEQFATVIMAATGYMPTEAIAFKNHKPRVTKLHYDIRKRLQTSGEIKVDHKGAVSEFIRQYVLAQNIQDINFNDLKVDEFLNTENTERRRVLGHTLLGLYTDKATEVVDETYSLAYKNKLVLPGLPNSAQRFAKALMGNRRIRENLVSQLHARLSPA